MEAEARLQDFFALPSLGFQYLAVGFLLLSQASLYLLENRSLTFSSSTSFDAKMIGNFIISMY